MTRGVDWRAHTVQTETMRDLQQQMAMTHSRRVVVLIHQHQRFENVGLVGLDDLAIHDLSRKPGRREQQAGNHTAGSEEFAPFRPG